MALAKLVAILGFVLMFHGCFSASQHRNQLKLAGIENVGLASDIIIELIIGAVLSLAGGAGLAGKLEPIRSIQQFSKTTLEAVEHPDFYSFHHRGASLGNVVRKHIPNPPVR
eukprot:GILJ01009521.1.p1 GENE.GILJ01009521.1~~GILJ01009521.1.p1  ORF type:complete len:112 (+),score=13.74 GILJ01009521.1:34-369(+)